jgi:hypothetical protein
MVAQKKSTLRGGDDKKPGPVQMMSMTHVGDQRNINLAVQVRRRQGDSKQAGRQGAVQLTSKGKGYQGCGCWSSFRYPGGSLKGTRT